MWNIKACIVCLSANVKLFNLDSDGLRRQFNDIAGLKTSKSDGMPEYLCYECVSHVRRFVKFRDKCKRANFTLKEMLHRNKELKESTLEAVNRKLIGIHPNLSYLNVDRAHYEQVKFHWVKNNRNPIVCLDNIPIVTYSTLTKEEMFQSSPIRADKTEFKDENMVKTEKDIELVNADINQIEITVDNNVKNPYEQPSSSFNDSNAQIIDDSFGNNDFYDSDNDIATLDNDIDKTDSGAIKTDANNADGSQLDEEYATILPITMREAQAVVEIYKMFGTGKHRCQICNKAFFNENRLTVHLRMHDKYTNGTYHCELCNYYYKTDFLLRTHMTEKHMYKYICRKCPEVTFHRAAAKQHYIWAHLQKGKRGQALSWRNERPSWLSKKGGKRPKAVVQKPPKKPSTKLPDDFLVYTPVTQEEQYELVKDRRATKNYIEAKYRCELCFRGFRVLHTYNKHMRKHDPVFSGQLQCDMCKIYFRDARKMYKHMNITHLFKFSCRECSYVCFNKSQAHTHYRWHKNVTYPCSHCDKEFTKLSTRLTHIRMKHPSSHICNLCGHSFVSETGLYCHKQIAHTREEMEEAALVPADVGSRFYCEECEVQFVGQDAYNVHLGSSNKHALSNISGKANHFREPVSKRRRKYQNSSEIVNNGSATSSSCIECGKYLVNDVQARKHYESEHPGTDFLKRYMCDVCGHTTKQYANLIVHMRTHTNEKPYECPHCDRRFSMPSNRDRHLVVHTGEKRYQCQHCNRRFTQSSAVKLHIQTVHLKIPYAPWDKKNRKRRKELEGAAGGGMAATTAYAPHKLLMETQGDYLNAYITYNDE